MSTRLSWFCVRRFGSSRQKLSRLECSSSCPTQPSRDDHVRETAPARGRKSWSLRTLWECSTAHKSAVPLNLQFLESFAARNDRQLPAARAPPGSIAHCSPAARDQDRSPSLSGT